MPKECIAGFVRRWNALLVMDATGVGDPVYDDLRWVLPHVKGFKITAQTKRELEQGLLVAVEQHRVMWPAGKGISGISELSGSSAISSCGDWEVLTAEVRRYEYDIGPTGQVSYAAPSRLSR